jgi:hypothetical protein
MIHRFWKIMVWFSLGAGCLFLLSAGVLAATLGSLDLTIHDQVFRDSAEQVIADLSLPLYRNAYSLEGQSFTLGAKDGA